jgi:hypothetical protein
MAWPAALNSSRYAPSGHAGSSSTSVMTTSSYRTSEAVSRSGAESSWTLSHWVPPGDHQVSVSSRRSGRGCGCSLPTKMQPVKTSGSARMGVL